jgi:hypothetical protein
MELLRQVLVTVLAIGAVISLAAMTGALYEFRTGRLVRYPFRRRVPATPEDIRKNALALVLNDLGTFLFNFIVVSGLLLQDAHVDPVLLVTYFAAEIVGIAAVFLSMFIAHHLRGEVRYMKRQKPASVPSAQA